VADQPALDFSRLPAFGTSTPDAEKKPTRGLFVAGLHSGVNDLESLLGAAVQGGGKAFGLPSVEAAGRNFSQSSAAASAANGRPDLETAPWHAGGAPILPWLGYQASKQAPLIAAYLLGAKGVAATGLEAPAALERASVFAPRALGGGGLRAGADFATRRAAVAAGKDYAQSLTHITTAGLPIAFGSMIQEADQKPGGVTTQDVKRAALLSPIYSALDAVEPAQFKGLFQRGQAGNIVRRVATAAFAGAAAEVPQEGIQTAMEQSFRPDLTLQQKFANIVDAAVTGGAVGGIFGGVAGVRAMKRVDPKVIETDDIQQAVDQALGLLPPPQAFTDASGRTVVGSNGAETLRATPTEPGGQPYDVAEQQPPALISPDAVEGRSAVPGSTIVVGRRGESGRFTSDATGVEQPPVVPDDTSRSFRNFTDAELFSASNALANRQEAGGLTKDQQLIVQKIDEELAFRRQSRNPSLTTPDVNAEPVEAVSARAQNRRGTGEQPNSAAPASASQPDWTSQRGELLTGISTRKNYVDAADPDELKARVQARLENGSSAAGDFKLAERLGIDTNAPAAPVETAESRVQDQAQQAPVATEFATQWKQDVQKLGQRDPAVRAIKPSDVTDAQVKLYRALGTEGVKSDRDGVERLAQKYGVLDENKQLTPLAIDIAKKDPIKTEQAVKAAAAQGFKGAAASMFDRGVRAYLGGEQVTDFSDTKQGEAYASGARWAEEHNSVPKVASNYWTEGVIRSQRGGNNTGVGTPITLSPEQRDQQAANKVLDAANVGDDLVELKRRVRSGDVQGAMEGLQRVQRGESLFQQPERAPAKPFKGEAPTRGAPRAPRTAELVPTRVTSRAEAERAIRKFQFQRAIDAAHAEGTIDGKERMRLVGKLRQGKMSEVMRAVPTAGFVGEPATPATNRVTSRAAQRSAIKDQFEELWNSVVDDELSELTVDENGVIIQNNQVKMSRRDFLAGVAATAAATVGPKVRADPLARSPGSESFRDKVISGDIVGTLKDIQAHSNNPQYRVLAGKLLRNDSWDQVHMTGGPESDIVNGVTRQEDDGSITVWIGWDESMTEETVLHELIHAYVGQRWSGVSRYTPHNKALLNDRVDRHDATIRRFAKIWDHISDALNKTNPGLIDHEAWAQEAYSRPDEMLAWVLTNPNAQAYLKSVDRNGEKINKQPSLWDMIVDFFAELFGVKAAKQVSALSEIMDAGYSVIDAGIGVKTGDFNVALHKRIQEQSYNQSKARPTAVADNDSAKTVVSAITRAAGKLPLESTSNATRKMVFGWNSVGHLVAHYAKQFPQLALYAKAHLERRATQARWAQLFEAPYAMYETLERSQPKFAETIRYLMSLTQFDIDPTKAWDQHEHLHEAANAERLKTLVEDANRKYNVLRGKGHAAIYDDLRAINEATHLAMMSVSLHNLVASDPSLKEGVEGFDVDPTDAFRESAQLHESAQNAQRYWSDMLDNQVKRANEYIAQLRGAEVGSSSEQKTQAMRLEPIELRIKSIQQSLAAMRNAPYFHLGRHGEHFVSFTLRLGEDKKTVDQRAIDHAGKVIEAAGFKNVEISRDSTKPNVYIRVETIEARHQLEKIVRGLQKQGWLKPESEIKAAPRNSAGDVGTADSAPAWLERYIELLQASPMFEPTDDMSDKDKAALSARKAQMVSHARELWLDMLPDTAIAKVMVHRNSVPGFDKDMIRNFAFRYQVGVNSLANLSANAKLNDAFTQMRAAVYDAQVSGSRQHGDVDLLQALMSEVQVREAQRPLRSGQNWIDTWRALNHAFFLGFSPSYVLVNTTQIGVLLWPELAKKHGFAKSAKAIAGVTSTAFNIMRETLAAGAKLGPKRALDAVITEDVLRRAGGVDEATAGFLMKVIADGIIDIGGASREMGRVAEGRVSEHLDTGLRWASSFGLYSETFTRLVAALAARKLNGDDLGYAHQVVEQSMLNYSDWNAARQMGKLGFAGPMTKVMTAFMTYNVQVMEKLYREFHTAMLSKNATKAEKSEARRFLGAHLTAVTTLAGTLGLPFASVAALAIEKLVDLFDDDDEPFDATAAWRNFLSGVLGKDLGEVVSRGAPRAGGFDLSQRAGEQSLMPFTQFLTDKRQVREAATEMALRSYGAPVSMLTNIWQGAEKLAAGDVLGGMATMAPMSIKGPTQAYRMTAEGYVDANGNKLPMSPSSTAVLTQLIGLTPQAKAEYSEARGDQQARKTVLAARAKTLRSSIADAVASGDNDRARELISQAKAFDDARITNGDDPSFMVLPDIESAIKRRARLQATSTATKTPIGVSPKDFEGQRLTAYANY
jgi:hypothetical protein